MVLLNPPTKHFEFMGPHGTFLAIVGLPLVTFALYFCCDENGCPSSDLFNLNFKSLFSAQWFTLPAMYAFLSWFAFQLILYLGLPGAWAQGTTLRTGKHLSYKINAFKSLLATLATLGGIVYTYDLIPLLWIADHYLCLCTAAFGFSTLFALYLYLYSFRSNTVLLAEGGNSGYPIYDFWMGRELNPRWTQFVDWKYFCELRPGLIGWTILNLSLAAKQYHALGYLTSSMLLVIVFQGYYVVDALWNERAILTTMDITTDGFGFMLVFGDLVWVPFTYTLQGKYLKKNFYKPARYLTLFPQDLSPGFIAFILGLKLLGFYIFRGANGEKNAFRTDPSSPSVAHLKYIKTASGSKLLISGWWGSARHINYFGIISLLTNRRLAHGIGLVSSLWI